MSVGCLLYLLRENVSSGFLLIFLTGFFLILSRSSCLNILEINSLLVVSFASIFSDSVTALFVLLVV